MPPTGGGYIRCLKNVRVFSTLSAFLLLTLTILSAFPIINHEEEAEAAPVASVTTLDITLGKNTASVDITPINAAGTFNHSPSANEVEFSVTTNNLTGYGLTLAARSGDTLGQLTNVSYGDTLDSVSTIISESDFSANSSYTNKWGIKPSKYVDSGTVIDNTVADNYLPAPTTTTGFAIDNTTGPNTTANTYTIGVGARVDYTKPSGTYTNTYILSAVSNPVAYTVNYLDDSPDSASVTGLPSSDAGPNAISKITLPTTTPTRATYRFNKWCDGTVTHSTSGDTCSGTMYTSGADYTPTPNGTNKLYAMWNPVSFDSAFAAAGATRVTYRNVARYTMQSMTTSICAAVTNDQQTSLLDNRIVASTDTTTRHVYTIRKINGNCWMIRDLVFGNGSYNGTSITLKASESNVPSDRTVYFYNLLSDTSNCPTPSTTYAGDGKACIAAGQDGNGTSIMYYNYAAASAGYVAGTSHATASSANYSLCPKGWRLPSLTHMQSLKDYKDDFPTGYGGYGGYNWQVFAVGDTSYWWGSEPDSGDSIKRQMMRASTSYTTIRNNTDARSFGFTIRCVAK